MSKKLTQIGTSWGFIIPKALLEVLKINPVTDKIDFEIEGKTLKITKASKDD